MDILAIAGQGLVQGQQQFDRAAVQMSKVSAPEDSVSLSDSVVALLSARNQMQADVATMKVANEMEKKTLDLLA